MKKLLWIGTLLALLLMGCSNEQDSSKDVESENNPTAEKAENESKANEENVNKEADSKENIKEVVKNIVSEDLTRTKITEVSVNNYQGEENKFIVLPHLIWEVKNKKGTTVEMLEMYSDNLAAKLYDQEGIEEITIFWEVPYHLEGENIAKFTYMRTDKGMVKLENWFAPVLQ